MRLESLDISKIISLHKDSTISNIYDVQINKLDILKKFHSLECHFILYPYHRQINAKHIKFKPFEEYVNDILAYHRSIYSKIPDSSSKIFGILLGILIFFIFINFQAKVMVSVEAIVSIFVAYTIGKELWGDIHKFFIKLTKNFRLSYIENYYSYQLEKNTTLTRYSTLAKKYRYSKNQILPQKIDFIEQSNSQTLRLFYQMKDLQKLNDSYAHLFAIHIDSELSDFFEKEGFMFGVKFTLNRKYFIFKKSYELFQSINYNSIGCLNMNDEWIEKGIFYRITYSFSNFKFFKSKGILKEKELITNFQV